MKESNFDHLLQRYVTGQTSTPETRKIEAMLDSIRQRNIHWVSDETEELLFRNINNPNISPEKITEQVMGLAKLHISDVAWMKFKGMDVYFDKEYY